MMKSKKVKIVVSSIATIFLVLLYCLIFSFSEQDGETSGGLSQMISEKCVEIFNALTGKNWSELIKHRMAEYFENPIRKLAHFCEYMVMCILVFVIWYPWIGLSKKVQKMAVKRTVPVLWARHKIKIIVVLWVFLSAVFDEVHQTFVPGRDGNFMDVLLDTTGGGFGLLLCILSVRMIERVHEK